MPDETPHNDAQRTAGAPIGSPATTALSLTTYEQAVNFVRQHGPMTVATLVDRMQWPENRVFYAVNRGRDLALLKRIGKTATGKFIYAAVQVPGWPQPAPDTVAS